MDSFKNKKTRLQISETGQGDQTVPTSLKARCRIIVGGPRTDCRDVCFGMNGKKERGPRPQFVPQTGSNRAQKHGNDIRRVVGFSLFVNALLGFLRVSIIPK